MNILSLLLLILNLAAAPAPDWSFAQKVVDRHEFYKDHEPIIKPAGAWQVLFAVLYRDQSLNQFKDCVLYQVPSTEQLGILKIKKIATQESCEDFLFAPGDREIKDVKSLEFGLKNDGIKIYMSHARFEMTKWDIPLLNVYVSPKPKMLMSSAEQRSPKAYFLMPYRGGERRSPPAALELKDKTLCHDISDSCEVKSPSRCSQCAHGWYEVPNGCKEAPKYCGVMLCGLKHRPACSRGVEYLGKKVPANCRENPSFVYCAKGLKVDCQGSQAWCL